MAQIKMIHPPFNVGETSMIPHVDKVFAGEYDVPLFGHSFTIIDIGANLGAFSIWASHRWPSSMILAYEPHPETFKKLKENVAGYPRVICHEYGIGNPGVRPLYNGINNCGEASLYSNDMSAGTGQHVTICSPKDLQQADIIKIDAEGAEPEILLPLLEEGRVFKAVMFEWHSREHRKILDAALKDYTLVQCIVGGNPNLGTACYIHDSIIVEIP